MKRCVKITGLAILLIAFGVTAYLAESSRPEWRKISPFTAIEISGETIHVEFDDTRYELITIEQVTASELIGAAKKRFGLHWDKRIREDIAEVLEAAGVEGADRVVLELRVSDSGEIKRIPNAKMTQENRNRIYQSS